MAQIGVRSRIDQQPRHPERPINDGGALKDASGGKSLKVKRRRWTELSMAMVGGGTALEAGGGSIEG